MKLILISILFIISVSGSTGTVDYSNPLAWAGNCQTGTAQSPIDINTKNI